MNLYWFNLKTKVRFFFSEIRLAIIAITWLILEIALVIWFVRDVARYAD